MGLYQQYISEITTLIIGEDEGRRDKLTTRLFERSEMIARLKAEQGYEPPKHRHISHRLRTLADEECERRDKAQRASEERQRLRRRRDELSRIVAEAERALEQASPFDDVEEIAAHQRRLEAAWFLVGLITEERLREPEPSSSSPLGHTRGDEIEALRAWESRLYRELKRIRQAFEGGDNNSPVVEGHTALWCDLAACLRGINDARVNLELAAERPPVYS
jgi:hypothetical protein